MSREAVVAKRYAAALFELAQQQQAIAAVEDQLKLVVEAVQSDAEIGKFLSSPNIGSDQKLAILKQALSSHVSELVLDTVALLIARRRQGMLQDVYEAYTRVAGDQLGQARATVYTAQELSADELKSVEAQFGKLLAKQVVAQQVLEPSLLGGIQVRIGDRLYDGSLSGKLARLEKTLKSKAL
ncbi:F0F1 ATP synthase subunit delta [Paenibacillus sp. 598K]|uniref:F0F1 ATP synthase subunit delta n=1 Tax=Paenibacillus sp. 598K TaxID=1117987 RepID=UPI000FF9F020|nr:F0F1 ATP synthase subunit delta [Paenibacillus sp. 598K]GBF74594.1 F0F1 ATP synthase subunit delta [Paenibacillus sp. 598K]